MAKKTAETNTEFNGEETKVFRYELLTVRSDGSTYQSKGIYETEREAHDRLVEIRDGKGLFHHVRTEARLNGVTRLEIVDRVNGGTIVHQEPLNHIDGV